MSSPAVRYLEHELTVYRRLWRSSLASSFLAPILFLAAIGGTLGKSIDHHGVGQFGGVSYITWLAPGLLAANAMQIGVNESMWPVLGGFKWTQHFIAASATPLSPDAVVEGWLTWVFIRASLVSAVFVAVAGAFGALHSPLVLLTIPVGGLTGLAFGAPMTAWAATRVTDDSFSSIQRFGVLPLFLFSGAFFPLTQLPAAVRPLAYALPLWHGVALCRALALGRAGLAASLGHVAALAAYAAAGAILSVVAFRRRLAGVIATSALAARLLPPADRPTRRASRVVERDVAVARQLWLVMLSGLFEPVFYLLSIGIGIGHLVGDVSVGGHLITYRQFVAPAMLASSAMNGAVFACTFNIYFRLKYQKTYDAMVNTPVGIGDIVVGEIEWALIRGAFYAACFVAVMLALGLVPSWWTLLSIPVAVLIGFCFAGVGMAGTSFMRSWKDFDYVTLAVMPLFLFSATFSPLSAYPDALRWVVRATPLYQGVAMERSLVLGHVGWVLLAHALYLLVAGSVGVVIASRRMGRLLLN